MQTLIDSLTKFISEHTDFSQDVFVAILGVVIGSILTVLINTRAMRQREKPVCIQGTSDWIEIPTRSCC